MRIRVFGDAMFGRGVGEVIQRGVDILSPMRGVLRDGAFNVCNLETPVVQQAAYDTRRFYATKASLPHMCEFQAVTLANNHILDQGVSGLEDTIAILDECGIQHTGAGIDKESAFSPVIVDDGHARVAILGVTSKVNISQTDYPYLGHVALVEDDLELEGFVELYRPQADLLIVLPHMGVEHVDCPSSMVGRAYRNLIDLGFDMVIASHPHVVQGTERYRGKLICYSLGDFVFDHLSSLRRSSMYITVELANASHPVTRFEIAERNELLQPVSRGEQPARQLLRRLNRYVDCGTMYLPRSVVCKSSNQLYNLRCALRTGGLVGAVRMIGRKLMLLAGSKTRCS